MGPYRLDRDWCPTCRDDVGLRLHTLPPPCASWHLLFILLACCAQNFLMRVCFLVTRLQASCSLGRESASHQPPALFAGASEVNETAKLRQHGAFDTVHLHWKTHSEIIIFKKITFRISEHSYIVPSSSILLSFLSWIFRMFRHI